MTQQEQVIFDPRAVADEIMNPTTGKSGTVELYQPGEIPPYWQETLRQYGVKIMQLAMTFGLVIPEYTMRDYINYAVESKNGYETLDIWGVQGSMKSNRTLQIVNWVYDDWEKVLDEIVLMPDAHDFEGYENRGFLQKMKSIAKGECVPVVGWDDITVNMPSSTFKTDIEQYGAVDAAWAAIRTKIKIMVLNNPLIDRLGRNIKDNITIECFIGRNQVELIERFIRLPGIKHLESNFFKVQIEPIHKFDWHNVPTDIFRRYHDLRLEIAEFAIQKMGKAFKDEAALLEDMMTPFQAMAEVGLSPTTFNDMLKRNVIPNEKVNNKPYINKKDVEELKKLLIQQGRLGNKKKQ